MINVWVVGCRADVREAVPPTNGWMLDLKYGDKLGYRIYVSGDTLLIDGKSDIVSPACAPG